MCFFEEEGLTFEADIRVCIQSAQGHAFEEAVLLLCSRLFRDGARLSDIFWLQGGNVPDWAHQTGYIVSQNGQEGPIVTDLVNGNPVLPSA